MKTFTSECGIGLKVKGKSVGYLERHNFFCSYELVRHIQQKIEAAIGPLVDRRLESGMYGEEEGHDLVAQITEEIFTSPE